MRKTVVILLAKQVLNTAIRNKAVLGLCGIILLLMAYAAFSGYAAYKKQTESRIKNEAEVRHNWENMPDKHPHRMAHYGYIAFRPKAALSFFDFGIESYTGNAVFLEAHRQNTVNFSEAGFSTGMLRFGEISMALILQLLVPLLIFFLGFNTIAAERENNTLKVLLSQGAGWKEIIVGKSLGLLSIAMLLFVPAVLMTVSIWVLQNSTAATGDEVLRLLWLLVAYTIFFAIVSVIAVTVSAISKTAKMALVSLIGIWLLFGIVLPRATQALGNRLHPSPSKIEFETAVEKELIQKGDSHNPDDPYYKALKDSVMKAYKAASVQQLPFNYGGFQMKEGERISAEIYTKHLDSLLDTYQSQNNVARSTSFINPFMVIKNVSMAFSGTDFGAYTRFQKEAEAYRYRLAQHMNELQMKLISNEKLADTAKPYSISKAYWAAFPDFSYKPLGQKEVMKNEIISVVALVFWIVVLLFIINRLSKKLKAV